MKTVKCFKLVLICHARRNIKDTGAESNVDYYDGPPQDVSEGKNVQVALRPFL